MKLINPRFLYAFDFNTSSEAVALNAYQLNIQNRALIANIESRLGGFNSLYEQIEDVEWSNDDVKECGFDKILRHSDTFVSNMYGFHQCMNTNVTAEVFKEDYIFSFASELSIFFHFRADELDIYAKRLAAISYDDARYAAAENLSSHLRLWLLACGKRAKSEIKEPYGSR